MINKGIPGASNYNKMQILEGLSSQIVNVNFRRNFWSWTSVEVSDRQKHQGIIYGGHQQFSMRVSSRATRNCSRANTNGICRLHVCIDARDDAPQHYHSSPIVHSMLVCECQPTKLPRFRLCQEERYSAIVLKTERATSGMLS